MSKKILIVDDEQNLVKGIRFNLEHQEDYSIDTAYDGQEALDKFEANDYDLILLDLMLPKIDGFDVCQRIRNVSDVPIIMLTAKGDDMDKIMGLEYGADPRPMNLPSFSSRARRGLPIPSNMLSRIPGPSVSETGVPSPTISSPSVSPPVGS